VVGCSDDGGGLEPGVNEPPTIRITEPADGARFNDGEPVPLRAAAFDAEDGALEGESVTWTSNKDGEIATGAEASPVISIGEHVISATAIDSESATAVATISIGIDPLPPQEPTASIELPFEGETFASGELVQFVGTATFPGVAELPPSAFVWSSSLDGEIGVGPQVSSDVLSGGNHLITLTVTDPPATVATASVSISIIAPQAHTAARAGGTSAMSGIPGHAPPASRRLRNC